MTADRNRVVIVGQGYVGLPLAEAMTSAGLEVIGLDSDPTTVAALLAGRSHVNDLSNDRIAAMLQRGYRASTDPAVLAEAGVVVICVPTPLSDEKHPDLRAVRAAAAVTAQHLTPGTLVVLESTSYPGTTDEVVLPLLLESGLVLDQDFHLAFSPERVDPGNVAFTITNTPKVVGGVSPASTGAARDFYARFVDTVVVTAGAREAEMAKLLENTYRHINIALVNEMARFCHELGIDIWDVIRAASTKPFGFQAFAPGPGVGGHCIPIDPNYLSYEVRRRLGYPFRFVELAEEINESMPAYVVGRVTSTLAEHGIPISDARVLILGVTYKANIADERESPSRTVADLLLEAGADVSFHDPYVDEWHLGERTLTRSDDILSSAAGCDLVLLLQTHREYDIDDLVRRSRLFFDTRGVTRGPDAVRL